MTFVKPKDRSIFYCGPTNSEGNERIFNTSATSFYQKCYMPNLSLNIICTAVSERPAAERYHKNLHLHLTDLLKFLLYLER